MQTVRLEPTTADELQPLKKQLNGHEFAAATAHGLAAHLTAAPLFIEKLRARTHPGDAQPCDEGGAVIQAVMDWMRCGRGDAIERDVLRLLWAYYLPQRTAPTDECFEAGLEWALRPVIGTASLLRVVSDTHYEIQQDVCSLALSGHDAELPPPREAAWIAALDALPDTERISVANAAMGYENWDTAGRAIEGAVEPADMVAKVWLTLGQRRLNDGQPEQARIAFQQALAAAAHETHQSMQRIAAAAAFGRATSLLVTGSEHVGEATRDLQQVYDAYHGSDDPFTKTAGLTALLLQAQTISGLGANHIAAPTRPLVPINPSPREESSAAQAVDLLTKLLAELRTTSRSPALQRRVHATALWYRAILAQVVKAPLIGRPALRSAAPVADLRRIIDAFSSDSDPAIRTLVLETTMWLGRLYSTEDVYAVCVGDDKDAQAAARAVQLAALREVDRRLLLPSTMSEYQFAQTLMTKTRLLGSLGTNKEILDTEISRITRDFGDSENVLVQNAVAVCRLLGAAAARKAGFANDAIKQYRSIARAYGGSSDDGLRSKVCTAEAAISELVASSDHPTCPQP
ncbi:hypothetical protein AU194_30040 [Mycobacterium sp. GA-2829]|nr:hypothetical protein AU194_30040 [Mycobacterium sp. GA-2829]